MKLVRTSHWARNCVLTKFDTLTALPYYQQAFRLDVGAWLSLVERTVRDREVGGSNPLAPTNQFKHLRAARAARSRLMWGLLCRSSFQAAKLCRFPSPLQTLLVTASHGECRHP